ncbi:transporter substrate-binding domain-containing protein [Desulfococcaceae bacterium HSG8]|nr:transporter substrate-binding domain-containing protein [Desulfococcaceae bacterium HSG8]
MKSSRFYALFLAIVLLFPLNTLAEEKIVLDTLGDFPPFQYQDDNGKATGTDIDIAYEVCKRLGLELEFRIVPWARALKEAEAGKVAGIIAALLKEERTKFLYYTTEPIHIQKNAVMIRKGSEIKIAGFDDLKGKSIGVIRKFSYGKEFDDYQGLKKEVCNNLEEVIKILNKGHVDVAMGSEKPFMFTAKQMGFQDKFEAAHVFAQIPVYTVFSKKLGKRGESLAKEFDTAIKQIREEGLEQQIIDKYLK